MLGSFISGVGQGAAGLLGQGASFSSAGKSRHYDYRKFKETMKFQREMANTAYQRGTKDMRKAGINPMLAYIQGGASAPSGGAGGAPQANVGNALEGVVSSALEARRLKKEIKAVDSQVGLNKQTEATAKADQAKKEAEAESARATAKMLNAQIPAAKAKAQYDKANYDLDNKYQKAIYLNNRAGEFLNSAQQIKSLFTPKFKTNENTYNPKKHYKVDKKTGEVY